MSILTYPNEDKTLTISGGDSPKGKRPGGLTSPYFGSYCTIGFENNLVYVPKPLIKVHPAFESLFNKGHLNGNDIPGERAHIITHYLWHGTLEPLPRMEETELAKQHGNLITLFKLRQDAHRFRLWGLEELTTAEMHRLGRQVGFLKLVEIVFQEEAWDFRGEDNWLREFFAKRVNDRTEYIPEPDLRRMIEWGNVEVVGRMEEMKRVVEFKIKMQELLEARLLDPFEGVITWNTPGYGKQQDRWNCIFTYESDEHDEPEEPEDCDEFEE